jgi:DNA modification methylase
VAELVWKGKIPRRARTRPERPRFPIQSVEMHGDCTAAEVNRFVFGDSASALPALADELSEKIDLVYIDPPFDTGDTFDFLASIPGAPAGAPRVAVHAYEDTRGLDAWLAWFSDTATLLHRLLAKGGSLYVHLDAHVGHYAKVLLDEVFGADAFQREIVWRIGWVSGFKSQTRGWIRNHDTVLFYAKGGKPKTFHKELIPYAPGYVRRDGSPPRGSGYPMEDVWNGSEADRLNSIQIVSFSGEKVGYPTQKNEALVARIIRASSNRGDRVVDCFVGSGTTAVVAEKLGRRWIVGDASPIALHVARKRLLAVRDARPWIVQHVGIASSSQGEGALRAVASVSGLSVRIQLVDFAMAPDRVPGGARDAVTHWSQWLDGWCVDWDHRDGRLRVGSSAWRPSRGRQPLALSLEHHYERSGQYLALVRAFDVLGGAAATTLCINIE